MPAQPIAWQPSAAQPHWLPGYHKATNKPFRNPSTNLFTGALGSGGHDDPLDFVVAFGGGYGTAGGTDTAENVITGVDGNQSADLLDQDAGFSQARAYRHPASLTQGTRNRIEFWAKEKPGEARYAGIWFGSEGPIYIFFDLRKPGVYNATSEPASIVEIGSDLSSNGFMRCWVIWDASGATGNQQINWGAGSAITGGSMAGEGCYFAARVLEAV